VGPRAGLDTEVRGKILCLCRGSNLDRPVVQPVVNQLVYYYLIRDFFLMISIAKCFAKSSKLFRCKEMLEDEHMLCS
jgi:hypothetical protein